MFVPHALSQEDAAEAETQEPAEDQQTVIMFERK